MRRQGAMVPLRDCEGFVMRYIKSSEAFVLAHDPDSGYEFSDRGGIQAKDYRQPNDSSPTCITVSDMKMNAGLLGAPRPVEKRRNGEIDPIESAIEKIKAWPEIGDVKREVFAGAFCPWPRIHTCFSNVSDDDRLQLEHQPDVQVREAWMTKLGLYQTFR